MENFAYASPATLQEVLGLLSNKPGDVEILAGGTDLISTMKEHLVTPRLVVNIKPVKELGGITSGNYGLRIGSTVTFDELTENATMRKSFPSLVEAARGVSSPQIRNMGTVGGDLCQRPRCWYFRQGYGLLGTDKGKALVPDGENRYHAILNNNGPAFFVSASSLGPALVALGATVRVVSSSGSRDIPADKFFVTPMNESMREIAIQPNELVSEIHIPIGARNATYEVREKMALDWPLATASVALKMNGSTVSSARVVLGHVAPTPFEATAADKLLAGKTITEEVATEAARQALMSAKPLSQNSYKMQLARVAVKRALLEAAKG